MAVSTLLWYHSPHEAEASTHAGVDICPSDQRKVPWKDIVALFRELKAEVSEREGSRVAVFLFNEVRVFHRPHPSPNTDKGAVASIRKWLEQHGVAP